MIPKIIPNWINGKECLATTAGKFEKLIEKISNNLEGKIAKVRLSKTLTSSPSCLVADEDGMDIQMEKMMIKFVVEMIMEN